MPQLGAHIGKSNVSKRKEPHDASEGPHDLCMFQERELSRCEINDQSQPVVRVTLVHLVGEHVSLVIESGKSSNEQCNIVP